MGWASLGEKRAEHPSVRGHECQKVDSVGYIFRPCGLATVQLQPLWRNWRNLQAYYVTVTEDRPILSAEYHLPLLAKTDPLAARSLCDSCATC